MLAPDVRPLLEGLDHIVLAVHDLEAAASEWRAAGFTVSTRGLHSEFLGTANHTVMFGDDYIELLGVLKETAFNQPTRNFLDGGEGLERLAMRTNDPLAAVSALRAAGVDALGPVEFRRPVPLNDGTEGEAAFRVFSWPDLPAPGGARIFACKHLTRETVWLPELIWHSNGATALQRVDVRTQHPDRDATTFAAMTGLETRAEAKGGVRVVMHPRGADIVFLPADAFALRWSETTNGCGIVLATTQAANIQSRTSGKPAVIHLSAASIAFARA